MKTRIFSKSVAFCVVLLIGLLANKATADLIVSNGSFELPVIPSPPDYIAGVPDSWSGNIGGGYMLFTSNHGHPPGFTGDQLCRFSSINNPTAFYQNVGEIGVVDSYVTLMVDVAGRCDEGDEHPIAAYTIQLEDVADDTVLAFKYNDPTPLRTAFSTCSTDAVLVSAGTSVRIRLFVDAYGSGPSDRREILMDNVRIEVTPIPEPGTLALLAAGLMGLLCYAWRRQK